MMNLLLIFAIFYIAVASDLDPTTFKASVIDDTRVWLVEFYSPMCGSCTEFAPTWAKVESAMKSVSTGPHPNSPKQHYYS